MRTISTAVKTLDVDDFCTADPDLLPFGVPSPVPSDAVLQELIGSFDDPDGIVATIMFTDYSHAEYGTCRRMTVYLEDAVENDEEAVVRWTWNKTTFEINIKYIGA